MRSKVYFASFDKKGVSRIESLRRVLRAATPAEYDFEKKFVAIKIHFGEPGNLAYLRPNYSRAVADFVREKGGRPFLTDCNTLYPGRRKNALEHMDSAYENGYNPFATGCQIIIADGLKGTDEAYVDIDGKYIRHAKIGRAIADADMLISMTHFKMHNESGIAGALKNIGMGCGSRAGKMEMHSSGKPVVTDKCVGCGSCIPSCAQDAISVSDGRMRIDYSKCVGCGRCIGACRFDAVRAADFNSPAILCEKVAEYAYAVVRDKPCLHINFVLDVSPDCDCHGYNDKAVVADIGIFASVDPIALDMACFDAVNAAPALCGSSAQGADGDKFRAVWPDCGGMAGIDRGAQMGLGRKEYTIIEV